MIGALQYAFTGLTIFIFGYLALGGIEVRILGVVFLALVVWSFYPKRHLETSIVIIALIAVFEASLNVQEFITGLFSTYGGSGIWIIMSGFVLAKGMEVSGLGKRIALGIATSMGCKPRNIILAVAVASMAIALSRVRRQRIKYRLLVDRGFGVRREVFGSVSRGDGGHKIAHASHRTYHPSRDLPVLGSPRWGGWSPAPTLLLAASYCSGWIFNPRSRHRRRRTTRW